jgi:enamine deaminase RidA (YjgF/YER057c/UK114 family)
MAVLGRSIVATGMRENRMDVVEAKLREIGLDLPTTPQPQGRYVPAVRSGHLIFVSGMGPLKDGRIAYVGRVGAELSEQDGYDCARLCALNALAAAKSAVGSLDKVVRVVQLRGFVNSAPGFDRQPEVLNGASELMIAVFGEKGQHARAALGTSVLPRNIAVELEVVLEVRD